MRNSVSAASSERWNPASGRVGRTHVVENASRGRVPPNATASLRWLRFILSLPSRVLSALIWVYQKTISPALVVAAPTCGCRFAPTCSHYAREALHEHGLLVGLALTARRLVKCGPWHPGGLDPVPQKSRPVCTAVRLGS